MSTTATDRARVQADTERVKDVAATVLVAGASTETRRTEFERLRSELSVSETPRHQAMAALMGRWQLGLFVGENVFPALPEDNYELERWFKLPKQNARHTHGRAHAGIVLVHRGPTRLLALDAHREHPGPFSVDDLRPYRHATMPESQQRTLRRAGLMRRARSPANRAALLADVEARYRGAG